MRDFLALMFLKGALLAGPAGVLESQGPNSRSARRICVRSVDEVALHAAFTALSPGRQREYHLHFSSAKQASTRASRVDE